MSARGFESRNGVGVGVGESEGGGLHIAAAAAGDLTQGW